MKKNKIGNSARQMWLEYYNRILRDKGVITEKEYRLMLLAIQKRYK